jgi:hypothetical protein
MKLRSLLIILASLCTAVPVLAKDLLPDRDDAQSLVAVTPRAEFIAWWSDVQDQGPTNHFPSFKAVDSLFPLQYCKFDPLVINLECSRTVGGEVVSWYTRAKHDPLIAKQLHSESSGSMYVRRIYACVKGCESSLPKRFVLVLWNTGG